MDETKELPEEAKELQAHIDKLNKELIKLNAELESFESNPKVHIRRAQVIKRHITKLNYTIGNRLVELNKILDEYK